jgi:hypothetical protein
MRDDFDERTKSILARRVGFRCSNPKCRKPTSGPQVDPAEAINIGVAAHIAAASSGGKRYDSNQSPEQRRSGDNGIWLCQSCSKLIDNDEKRYTVELLESWKSQAETLALREIQENFPQQSIDKTDPLETLLELLNEPDNWSKVQGDEYIRHRFNAEYIIKTGETINSDYQEPWTQRFLDKHAWSYYVEYWQGSTLLKRSCFVVADGGRYIIPLPKLHNKNPNLDGWGNIEFSIDVNSLEWKTAMLFDQYDSLWSTLPRVGVNLTS